MERKETESYKRYHAANPAVKASDVVSALSRVPWLLSPLSSRDFHFFEYDEEFGKYLDWLMRNKQKMNERTYVHYTCWKRDGKYHLDGYKIVTPDIDDFMKQAQSCKAEVDF